jgi:hypothetical protein
MHRPTATPSEYRSGLLSDLIYAPLTVALLLTDTFSVRAKGGGGHADPSQDLWVRTWTAPERCSYGLSRADSDLGSAANTSRAT